MLRYATLIGLVMVLGCGGDEETDATSLGGTSSEGEVIGFPGGGVPVNAEGGTVSPEAQAESGTDNRLPASEETEPVGTGDSETEPAEGQESAAGGGAASEGGGEEPTETEEPREPVEGTEEGGSEEGGETFTPSGTTVIGCYDGDYEETVPTGTESIAAELAAYSPAGLNDFVYSVLDKRYPLGSFLVEGGMTSDGPFAGQDCIGQFVSNTSSGEAVIGALATVVHECGHFYDINLGGFFESAFVIREDLTFSCPGGAGEVNGGPTFARSLIKNDKYSALWTPCENFGDQNCQDSYAGVYLSGDPFDGQFDSGDQGFDSVLEEVTQYVNSLATDYAFDDFISGSISARDGILTFLWYTTRYLKMAREEYPSAYTSITTPCWREVILTVWGRAWLYLGLTEGNPKLGLKDDIILDLVLEPELLEEIDRLREMEGCL